MDDVESLLRTGSFRTARSKSPNPTRYDDSYQSRRHDLPVRGIPETTTSRYKTTRTANTGLRIVRPPPPSVEDEASALAKEHGDDSVLGSHDEEPKHRGDVDQYPVLLPVDEDHEDHEDHEDNPERRFVIIGGTESSSENDPGQSKTRQQKYDANTGRKMASSSDEDSKEEKRRPISKRKSHQDLPRLDTHPEIPSQNPINRSNSRRRREKAYVSQDPRELPDRNDSSRPINDGLLSPEAIFTQITGGREREYWDTKSAANGGISRRRSMRGDPRAAASDEKRSTTTQSAGPGLHRRTASNAERPNPALDPLIREFKYSDADHALAFMMQDDDIPPRRRNRGDRTSNSPPYPPSEQDRRHSRSPAVMGRRQSFREQGQYYGDDSLRSQRSDRAERSDRPRPRRPTLERDSSSLLSPDQAWPPTRSRSKSKSSGSPLPSPRATKLGQFPDADGSPLPSPRSPRSATFPPTERESRRYEDRPVSPGPPAGISPPRRAEEPDTRTRARADSRTAASNNYFNISSSTTLPLPIPVGRSDVPERRPSPGPPSPTAQREDSIDTSSPKQYWQPGPFDPSKQNVLLDKPITSYRRYSEDVQKGVLPQLPDCSWKSPQLGRRVSDGQFLSLPRADFDVCLDCHEAVFANTEFGRMFVPASNRSDRPISCDFGSSPWYRIAYLMTLKSRLPDLRLLQGIATVAERQQPCAGDRPANRIWYTMMEPRVQRPIQTFNVCYSCAKMVEVLMPNLAGIFVPLGSASEPTRGICALHFAPDRKRFTEYFDVLEKASDRALSRRTAPDIQDLAEKIKNISRRDECPRSNVVTNKKWHIMDTLPEFTVCDECFGDVVWPYIQDKDPSTIPRYFYNRRQVLPAASCMLYSDRMREVFRRACRRDDMGYLEDKVNEKLKVEYDVKARIAVLQRDDPDDSWVQRELMSLDRQLREIE